MIKCVFCQKELVCLENENDVEYISCVDREEHRKIDNRQIWCWVDEFAENIEALYIVKNLYQLCINFTYNQTTLLKYKNTKDPSGNYVLKINQLMLPKDEADLDVKIKTLLTFM